MKNKVSIILSLILTIAGSWTASTQAQSRSTAAIRLPHVTTQTTPAPRNLAPAYSPETSSPAAPTGCLVMMGDGLPTRYVCPGAAGTSTSGNANNTVTSGGASSESLCAEVLSGRLKVTGPLSCFGEGGNPQALAPTGSPNAHLPLGYVNSIAPGFAPSTQPGITNGVGDVPSIEGSSVVGADTFAEAGRSSQGGSCSDLNSSMDALMNNSGSGGSSPDGQCMAGNTDDPTQSASANIDESTQAPLPQNVVSTASAQEAHAPNSSSDENSIADVLETGWDFAKYWIDPETDVLGTAIEYWAPKADDSTGTYAMKVGGLVTAGTLLAVPTTVAVGSVAGIEELKHFPHNMATLTNGMGSAGHVMVTTSDQSSNEQAQPSQVYNATPSPSPTPSASNPGSNN